MRKLPRYKIICKRCQKEFEVENYRKDSAVYCSKNCTLKSNRPNQNNIKRRTGADHHAWVGGIRSHTSGYILELCKDHPHTDIHGYVFQHRLVMEKHVNRILDRNETIHHKNGIKTDNRIENLEIIGRAEHSHLYPRKKTKLITSECKLCRKKFTWFPAEKRSGFCSQKCWYTFFRCKKSN